MNLVESTIQQSSIGHLSGNLSLFARMFGLTLVCVLCDKTIIYIILIYIIVFEIDERLVLVNVSYYQPRYVLHNQTPSTYSYEH